MRKISISNEFFITIFFTMPYSSCNCPPLWPAQVNKQLLHNYNLEKYAKKWCYVQFNGKMTTKKFEKVKKSK